MASPSSPARLIPEVGAVVVCLLEAAASESSIACHPTTEVRSDSTDRYTSLVAEVLRS